jgi:class 3 adenylate cyclase
MATLDAKKRASLPNSAFAYIDSKGNRRLPIHDEAHVRNALSRFNQVKFESDEAREKAFRKLLKAATSYGIAPVGFVTRQLREAARSESADLPSGKVTLLMTDIEASTELVHELGDEYPGLLERVRDLVRGAIGAHAGYEVDARADEFFAVHGRAADALAAAIEVQKTMASAAWPGRRPVKVRIGIHSGSPAVTDTGYVGLPVHVMARVCAAGHGGQILLTAATRDELEELPDRFSLKSLGDVTMQGLPEPEELYQVVGPGLDSEFPRLRVAE